MTLPPKLSIRDILDPEADDPLCRFLRALLMALLIGIGILVAGVLACPIAGCQATTHIRGQEAAAHNTTTTTRFSAKPTAAASEPRVRIRIVPKEPACFSIPASGSSSPAPSAPSPSSPATPAPSPSRPSSPTSPG